MSRHGSHVDAAAPTLVSQSKLPWDVDFFGRGPSIILPAATPTSTPGGASMPTAASSTSRSPHAATHRPPTQLLLGAKIDALNFDALAMHRVRVVINLIPKIVGAVHEHAFAYHCFDVEDDEEQDISWLFDTCSELIATQLAYPPDDPRAGAVFVHCAGGISRSASIVIAFCMKHHGWSYDER
jgi:hypothetical protein